MYRFNRQNTTSVRIGRTIPNIFNNILILGSFYDMEVEMDNFNTINVLHTFFTEVYGENYPIDAIMQNVRFFPFKKLKAPINSFIFESFQCHAHR